jgi:hypothetical protein
MAAVRLALAQGIPPQQLYLGIADNLAASLAPDRGRPGFDDRVHPEEQPSHSLSPPLSPPLSTFNYPFIFFISLSDTLSYPHWLVLLLLLYVVASIIIVAANVVVLIMWQK